MLYWLHQILYTASVIAWMSAVVFLIREFFRDFRGRVYDDSGLNQHAGPTGHEAESVPHTAEYMVWMTARSARVKKWLKVFLAGVVFQVLLHLAQTWVLPSFEIPFYSQPTAESTGDAQPEEEQMPSTQ